MENKQKPTILAIDDEKSILKMYKLIFDDYIVETAETCEEGIKKIEENKNLYDIILSDLNQTPNNGVDVAETAKKYGIPTLIITGGADSELEQKAKEAVGDSNYLMKPQRMSDLSEKIEKTLKQYRP